jgi:hypothetical protein
LDGIRYIERDTFTDAKLTKKDIRYARVEVVFAVMHNPDQN